MLVDIPQLENPTKGKALDMLEASPVQGFDANITGTANYEDTAGSDIVVITAGIARKPGMSRDDLVATNEKIMRSVTKEVVKYSPDCIIIVLTNPVDAMTYAVYKESGFPERAGHRPVGNFGYGKIQNVCRSGAQPFRQRHYRFCTGRTRGRYGSARSLLLCRRHSA